MKNRPFRSSKLKMSAKDQMCSMNVVDVCNYDPSTTVLAHINTELAGMGSKVDDFSACFCCSDCHVWLDQNKGSEEDMLFYTRRALVRTWKFWINNDYFKL